MNFLKIDNIIKEMTPENESDVKEYLKSFDRDKVIELLHCENVEEIKICDLFDYTEL
jgi:hypothetical protein